MASSLQSQLLKSGLADNKRVKKIHQQQLEAGKNAKDETKEAVAQAMALKAERDRELNRQKKEELERKAIGAQIKQLIEVHRIDRKGGEIHYQFTDQGKIKKIYVTDVLLNQLVKGQSAIVRFADAYELVPTVVAEKIALRDADSIVVLNTRTVPTTQDVAEEDPYANYQIPDDLMW
ncbi:DUF2058 domain-containing protein [Moraxellaceae bacterium AER2_44_116]|nr:DUF2058 domain-containing protein [Moraxellaceae bacterium]TQC99925.1 DUF2058 domain-containing protein [Moraxellaceae bacterium AER2_44_116]